ncbi:hypothetical protein GGX14DRAFT_399505 [Mycena pura]|uniref:Uncharacterized protein n=1 Tax=Mycena pura TaxID=153505 RepID=A0AAD6V6P8_9AGAR|nr:hypothetical protein GGX14DRAFT_399505 [Mycena pura]
MTTFCSSGGVFEVIASGHDSASHINASCCPRRHPQSINTGHARRWIQPPTTVVAKGGVQGAFDIRPLPSFPLLRRINRYDRCRAVVRPAQVVKQGGMVDAQGELLEPDLRDPRRSRGEASVHESERKVEAPDDMAEHSGRCEPFGVCEGIRGGVDRYGLESRERNVPEPLGKPRKFSGTLMEAVMGYAVTQLGRSESKEDVTEAISAGRCASTGSSASILINYRPYQALSRSATLLSDATRRQWGRVLATAHGVVPNTSRLEELYCKSCLHIQDIADGPPPGPRRRLRAVSQALDTNVECRGDYQLR